ncbi:MAG: hypothetical protein QM840_11655 [Verrucomicrobiota bacterium]|jgi:hypothetical protein|nr:hypothetical protein [Verrucomicrobiota bacterium]
MPISAYPERSPDIPCPYAVYKWCTTDAQRVYKGFSIVHLVSIRCTPVVHPLYTARR